MKTCQYCGKKASELIPARVRGLGFRFLCPECWLKLVQEGKIVYGTACAFRENLVRALRHVAKGDVSDFS